jgi:hypothetical protein
VIYIIPLQDRLLLLKGMDVLARVGEDARKRAGGCKTPTGKSSGA